MPIPHVTYENRAVGPITLVPTLHAVGEAQISKIKEVAQNLGASPRNQEVATLQGGDLGHVVPTGHSQMSE